MRLLLQVRARTSAGYGAFSRRFEFQTSPRESQLVSSCPPPSACLTPPFSPPLTVTASSERAQASIVAAAVTLALVLLALVAGFLLSGR